jgi:hypothetical protein
MEGCDASPERDRLTGGDNCGDWNADTGNRTAIDEDSIRKTRRSELIFFMTAVHNENKAGVTEPYLNHILWN